MRLTNSGMWLGRSSSSKGPLCLVVGLMPAASASSRLLPQGTATARRGICALHRRPHHRRLGPHVREQGFGGPAIDLEAVRFLVSADQRARIHAGLAIDFGNGIPQRLQLLLDALDAPGGKLLD